MKDPDPYAPVDEVEATRGWQLRRLSDAYQKRTATEYIVDGLIATYSLSVFYGAPGTLKSFLLADLCGHVAGGTAWLPGTPIRCEQTPVLWVDFDNGTRRTDARFDAIGRAMELSEQAPLYYTSMPEPPLVAHDFASMEALRDAAFETQARLVVIDNLGLITGEIEENSAGMARIMGNLRALVDKYGLALVLIHHQRKGGAAGNRAGDALRGHSSIEAALDLAVHVVREPASNVVNLRSTKSRDVELPPLAARFNFEHHPGTHDLALAWFDGVEAFSGDLRQTILDVVTNHDGISKMSLVESVRDLMGDGAPGINKVRGLIDDMLAKEEGLREVKTGTYRLVYGVNRP